MSVVNYLNEKVKIMMGLPNEKVEDKWYWYSTPM